MHPTKRRCRRAKLAANRYRALLHRVLFESVGRKGALPIMLALVFAPQKRAKDEVERAQSLDIPISELSVKASQRKGHAESSRRPPPKNRASRDDGGQASTTDVGGAATPRDSSWFSMNKVAECREQSQSAWLHFPHIELIFLLFAFEGAVVAQVAAIRESTSPVVFILAIACLVSLPTLKESPPVSCFRAIQFSARYQKHPIDVRVVTFTCRNLIGDNSHRISARVS